MAISEKALRRRGVDDDTIKTAKLIQGAQRRQRCKVQTINQIINGVSQLEPDPDDLTVRQLRKRGRIGQAALLLDQEAIAEPDLLKKTRLRFLSREAKILAEKPVKLEFDFFKGNRMISDEFHDVVRDRLKAVPGMTTSKMGVAALVLAEICRHLPWEDHTCPKTAAAIAEILDMNQSDMTRSLALLEEIKAIRRVKSGRTKVITVTPEGSYRGNVNHHAEAVGTYKKAMKDAGNVIPLRPEP